MQLTHVPPFDPLAKSVDDFQKRGGTLGMPTVRAGAGLRAGAAASS